MTRLDWRKARDKWPGRRVHNLDVRSPENVLRAKPKSLVWASKPIIAGCTCGKRSGFSGEHKKSCPLVTSSALKAKPQAESRRTVSLIEFANAIKKAGHQQQFRHFLNIELQLLKSEANLSPRQRDETSKAILALLDGLKTTVLE